MPESTPNYNLAKPSLTDAYDVGVQNSNMDKIDAALADKADLIDGRIDTGQMPINVVPIATTSGSGSTYTATIDGITGLSKGLLLIIIPHISSASSSPTLNVNALGAKTISRRTSSSTASGNAGNTSAWLTRGVPLLVQYDGTCWVAVGQAKPDASDLHGTAPVSHGGTGVTGWTAYRLVYASGKDTLGQLAFPASGGSILQQDVSGAPYWSTPAEVLEAIGAAPAAAGLPPGGTMNQVPVKASDADYDIRWLDPNWGSGGGPHASTHASAGSDPLTPAMIGAAPAPYYLSITILPEAWRGSEAPYIATMTQLNNVQTGDYMIAGITSTGGTVNDLAADCNAWNCVSVITPRPAALYLQCYETKPDRPLSLILVGWHTTNAIGYCYLTGHASANSGGGGTGADGREIELRKGTTAIEWRYVGDTTWQTLVLLADITGPQGARGATGAQGPAGQGIPVGGAAGQVLVKRSSTDYDTNWATPASGGGGGGTPDAHASTHATGGSDPITPASIGAAASSHNHSGTYAPVSHAVSSTTYGAGSGTNYGHIRLSDVTNSTSGVSGGIAATPKAVKAAYDLANGKADANHNHDDRYALIDHTHGGSGNSVEYVTITVPASGWTDGSPSTQQVAVTGVVNTDYITAKYTSNAISIAERAADHAAYCCITDGMPLNGHVLLTCLHEQPTRDINIILRTEHGGTTGYMVMTGQAASSAGAKTASGSVSTSVQTITVAGLGFRPSMVTFIGSSGKTTVTSGYGTDTGSATIARYADASGPGNVGTFSPVDDGFTLTVQGADAKTLSVSWYAVGS